MKIFITALLLLPLVSVAQDCKLKKSTDPFTHETKLSTGFQDFSSGKEKASISVDATPSVIDFFIWITSDQRCYDENSMVEVIFVGEKTKWKFKNTGSMNCDGAFHFSFKNYSTTNSQLNRIATQKIAVIKVTGTDKSEALLTLNPDQQTLLMNMAACAANEGKSLIPPPQQ